MSAPLPSSAWTTSRPPSNGTWGHVGGIVVHHPGDGWAAIAPALRAEVAARPTRHREHRLLRRGWGDIGSDPVADQAGRAWELRALDDIGAHCASAAQPGVSSPCVDVLLVVGAERATTVAVDGPWGPATTRALQRRTGAPPDGASPHQRRDASNRATTSTQLDTTRLGSAPVRAVQEWLGGGIRVDGLLGSSTVAAMQRCPGTPVDGTLSPVSTLVKELQRRLAAGSL